MLHTENTCSEPGSIAELFKPVAITILSLSSLRDCTTFMKEEGLSNSPGETCTAPEVWPWRQTGMTVCPQPEQPEESHAGRYSWGWAPPASRESSLSGRRLHALSPQSFEWRSPESNWATSEHSY